MSGSTTDPTTQQDTGTGNRSYTDTANDQCGRASTQIIINEGKGDKGDPGQAATITVQGTNTLDAGQPADVKNVGTSSDAVLVFDIPKGDKGDPGDPADPAALEALEAKTTNLADDGSAYTGTVSGAQVYNPVTQKDDTLAPTLDSLNTLAAGADEKAANAQEAAAAANTSITTLDAKTFKLSDDGYTFSGAVDVETTVAEYDVTAGTVVRHPITVDTRLLAAYAQNLGMPLTYQGGDHTATYKDGGNILVMAGGTLTVGTFDGVIGIAALKASKAVFPSVADVDWTVYPPKQPAATTVDLDQGDVLVLVSNYINANCIAWYPILSKAVWTKSAPLLANAVGTASGVQGLDEDGAIVTLTTAADGTNTGAGKALVTFVGPDGSKQSAPLGAILANVANSGQSVDAKISKLSEDGSKYTGEVSDATYASVDAPTSLTSAGALNEVRFDDADGIIYRCVKGGADGAAKWIKFYASTEKPLAPDANGGIVDFALQNDGTYQGSGNAQVVYKAVDGTIANVGSLGELLAYFNNTAAKAVQSGAIGNTIDEFHLTLPDGSKLDYTEAAGLQLTGRDGKVRFAAGSTVTSLVAYDGTGNATAGILITPSMMLVDAQNNTPYIVSTSAAAPPAPNNVDGQVGEIRFDDNYMYRKVATDKWVRFPVDTTWTA